MDVDSRMIVGFFNYGSSYVTTLGDRKKLFPSSEDIGEVDIEEWKNASLKANYSADLAVLLLMFMGGGLLGGALSEAGKDLYSSTKRGVVRLLHLKIKETYRSNTKVVYIQLVDDTPVGITLNLFQNISGEEAPTEEEIDDQLEAQFETLDREWAMVESEVRRLRVNYKTISVTVSIDGHVTFETKWPIPGWRPSAEAPGRVERLELREMLKEWKLAEEQTNSVKETLKRFDDMGF